MNKYRGKVPIQLGGQTYTLQYDMTAIAALKGLYGGQGHMVLIEATASCNVEVLAAGVSVGLERNHPGKFSAKDIMAMNPMPPIAAMQEAVYECVMAAFYGVDGPPDEDDAQEKKPLKRLKMWWSSVTQSSRRKNVPSRPV